MAKLKQDEGPEFFRDSIVYREWGYRLAILEKYPIAESYFEKAIQQGQDNNLRTYMGLCKLQLNYARYLRAMKTTEKCAEIAPSYSRVKQLQVQALFQVGEFEYSLVHAHQGYRRRKTTALEHGIHQGIETIDDCVGKNTHPKALQLLEPWIRKLEEYRQLMIEKLKEEVDELTGVEEQVRFQVNSSEVKVEAEFRKLQSINAKIYLGRLAHDLEFLRAMAEEPGKLESANKKTTEELYELARKNHARAVQRQSILRTRRPLYVRLFERRAIPKGHRMMIQEEKKLKKNLIIVEADFLLRKLYDTRMRKDYITFFRMVDRVKDKFDAYSPKMFPLKQKCLNAMYNMVAWAYIDTRDLTHLQSRKIKRTYLKHHLGIREAELPRDCDIAWVQALDGKEALRVFRRRLAMSSELLELAWLFHELCKHLIQIHRYDLARFYCKKALDTSEEADSEQWILNTYHLLLRIEISQNYRNEAKEAALLALSSSKKLGLDFLVDFYKHCIDIIDDMDVEKMLSFDAIAVRQQLILDLMPEDMKAEVDFLWRRMEAVPAKRRLSVMPGVKPVDKKFKLPCKRMTILPTPPKDYEKEARRALLAQYETSKERPGYMDFNEFD